MLKTQLFPPSAILRPVVWCYGHSQGYIAEPGIVVPLPARPKQVLTFFFRDRFRVQATGAPPQEAPFSVLVGPQTCRRAQLSVSGHVDNFTIHFQPAGFHHLFGVHMRELANASYDARDVVGRDIFTLGQRLGETRDFTGRIRLAEVFLVSRLGSAGALDAVGVVANQLFLTDGGARVSELAAITNLSVRHFQRKFLAQVGVEPKLYARIVRFSTALDRKLTSPGCSWTDIAHALRYHDQMHMIRDFRALSGEVPSTLIQSLSAVPELRTLFAAGHVPFTSVQQ